MFANGGGHGGGGVADDEAQAFIEKDRCEHQDCYYSTSSSRSCRSINGESKCDLLRRVLRQCPGEPQREVFASRSTEEGGGAAAQIGGALGGGGGFGDFFLGGGGAREGGGAGGPGMADPFALMEEMMGQFFGGGMHGGMHGGGHGAEHRGGGGGGGVPDGRERHRRWQQQEEQMRRQPEMPAPHRFPRGRYAPEARSAEPPRTFDARDFKGPVEDV